MEVRITESICGQIFSQGIRPCLENKNKTLPKKREEPARGRKSSQVIAQSIIILRRSVPSWDVFAGKKDPLKIAVFLFLTK